MHRVELKDRFRHVLLCGRLVPNAPCGVERPGRRRTSCPTQMFLMHRVELKNAHSDLLPAGCRGFLMHRVELKVVEVVESMITELKFLMHRVELKATHNGKKQASKQEVPNAPCGVESHIQAF